MTRRDCLVVFPDKSLPVLEEILPLVVAAHADGCRCVVALVGRQTVGVVQSNRLAWGLLADAAEIRSFGGGAGVFGRLMLGLNLCSFLFGLRFSSRRLVFVRRPKSKGFADEKIQAFLKLIGRVVSPKGTFGIFTDKFLDRYDPVAGRKFQEEAARLTGQGAARTDAMGALFDRRERTLVTSATEAAVIARRSGLEFTHVVVGIPRLHPAWPDALRRQAIGLLTDERERLGLAPERPVIVFAPTDPVAPWVRDEKTGDRMVEWLVQARQRQCPTAQLVVKPKPKFAPHYRALVDQLGDPDVTVSVLPLPAWTLGASVAVVASPSVAIFEFLCQEVPTIELADYPDWFGNMRFPWAGTPGLLMAEGLEETGTALKRALFDADAKPSRAALAVHFGQDDAGLERLFA